MKKKKRRAAELVIANELTFKIKKKENRVAELAMSARRLNEGRIKKKRKQGVDDFQYGTKRVGSIIG
jgi:hypothetical protein